MLLVVVCCFSCIETTSLFSKKMNLLCISRSTIHLSAPEISRFSCHKSFSSFAAAESFSKQRQKRTKGLRQTHILSPTHFRAEDLARLHFIAIACQEEELDA